MTEQTDSLDEVLQRALIALEEARYEGRPNPRDWANNRVQKAINEALKIRADERERAKAPLDERQTLYALMNQSLGEWKASVEALGGDTTNWYLLDRAVRIMRTVEAMRDVEVPVDLIQPRDAGA